MNNTLFVSPEYLLSLFYYSQTNGERKILQRGIIPFNIERF